MGLPEGGLPPRPRWMLADRLSGSRRAGRGDGGDNGGGVGALRESALVAHAGMGGPLRQHAPAGPGPAGTDSTTMNRHVQTCKVAFTGCTYGTGTQMLYSGIESLA